MPQGFDTPIDQSNIAKLLEILKETPKAAREADRALKEMGSTVKGIGPSKTPGGTNKADLQYVSARGGPSGPYESLDRAKLQLYLAQREGYSGNDLKDFQYRAKAAQRRAERADSLMNGPKVKSQEELIMDAIMTSRILPGGTLSPIVGRMVKAGLLGAPGSNALSAGIGGAAGSESVQAVAAAAAAALPMVVGAAGVAALVGLAEGSSGKIRTGSNAFWQTGGTASELGQMLSLGGDNAGSKAMSLAAFLRGGGYGANRLRAAGIADFGDFFTPDKAANYVKTLKYLRTIKDPMERLRIARGSGIEDDLWTSDLSNSSFNDLLNSRTAYGSSARKSEAEYRAAKEQFGNGWDDFVRSIGTPVLNGINAVWKGLGEIGGGENVPDRRKKAQANASPSQGTGSTVYRSPKSGAEWIGGDERSRGAVPPGVIAQSLDTSFNFEAIKLGAFSISG
jgi:hypothetical protein